MNCHKDLQVSRYYVKIVVIIVTLYAWGHVNFIKKIGKSLTPTSIAKDKKHFSFHVLLSTDKAVFF